MLDSIGIGTRFTAIQNLFAYAGKIGVLKKDLALRNWLFTRLDIYSFARFIHIQTYVIYSASLFRKKLKALAAIKCFLGHNIKSIFEFSFGCSLGNCYDLLIKPLWWKWRRFLICQFCYRLREEVIIKHHLYRTSGSNVKL